MKPNPVLPNAAPATLQTILDRLAGHAALSETRKRDLRSAVTSFAKLLGQPPAAIPLDLADIRRVLDSMVPARAQISRKRWANLRSDLAAAIEASGLLPMLKTSDVELDEVWTRLLATAERRVRLGLGRFAGWASLRGITPEAVDASTIARFGAELEGATLIRNLRLPSPRGREGVERPGRTSSGCWAAAGRGANRYPYAKPDGLAAASSLVPGGRGAAPRLGCGARPTCGWGSGSGAGIAVAAPEADPYPFGDECGGCRRGPRWIRLKLWRALSNPRPSRPSCAISGSRRDASCRPTPMASRSR